MQSANFPLGVQQNNPLVESVFVRTYENEEIAPGNPKFLITEDGRYITTEDGRYITTEN